MTKGNSTDGVALGDKPKTDSRCNYLAQGICNKCGREHDGGGSPWPGISEPDGVQACEPSRCRTPSAPCRGGCAQLIQPRADGVSVPHGESFPHHSPIDSPKGGAGGVDG